MSHDNQAHDNPILAAWREQLERARANPFLLQLLLKQFQRVLKRLAYFYAQLASLPRRNRRALQRALATSLIGAAMLLALSSAPVVHAASMTVDGTTLADDGACSLVEAIMNSNSDSQVYTTVGECPAGSGADTITLPVFQIFNYTNHYETYGALPYITSEITIHANSSFVLRDLGAADDFRIFTVTAPNGDLTLNNVNLSQGFVTGLSGGGAIFNIGGALEVNESYITGNFAYLGGGGIATIDSGYTLINDSTISFNGGGSGGGVANIQYATTVINDSAIYHNYSTYEGGGITNGAGTVTLNGTTVSENDGTMGGGIFSFTDSAFTGDAVLNLNASTVDNNYAFQIGGGIFSGAFPFTLLMASSTGEDTAPSNHRALVTQWLRGNDQDTTPFQLQPSRATGDTNFRPRKNSAALKLRQQQRGSGATKFNKPLAPNAPDYTATATINQSTISNNSAEDFGGGIETDYGGYTYLINSTVSSNTTNEYHGGGINVYYGVVSLTNVTMTDNQADEYGGGIASYGGNVTLVRSLISGNRATQSNEIENCPCGTMLGDNFNLFGHDGETNAQAFHGFVPGASDFLSTSDGSYATLLAGILDTTLALNSNPFGTLTNALVTGSPAIDKAPNADCAAAPVDDVDQRGAPRNFDFGPPSADDCDIGAFEYGAPTAVNVTRFTGRAAAEKNVLKWRTTTESQIAGFNVYRKVGKGKWKQLNAELKQAKTPGDAQGHRYVFRDKKVRDGRMYRYKIQVQYLDNHTEWTDVILVSTK